MTNLATKLRERLALADPVPVTFERREVVEADGYVRERIEYLGLEGDPIQLSCSRRGGATRSVEWLSFTNTMGSSTSARAK